MLDFLKPPPDRRYIDHGRVYCPLRAADMDVDMCTECRFVREVHDDLDGAFVRCRPEVVSEPVVLLGRQF